MDASTKEYKRGKCLICTTAVFQAYFKAAQLSGLMQMIGMLPMVLFLPFAKPLTEKFGKKEASAFCSIFSVIACIVMNIVPMPANMTGFTLLSSLLNFVAIKWIYPLDQKTLAQMNKDLGS